MVFEGAGKGQHAFSLFLFLLPAQKYVLLIAITPHRRPQYFNAGARSCLGKGFDLEKSVNSFHTQVKGVYAKDETNPSRAVGRC
jgi:hypothetical protein